jgi:regulator of sigma E protease
MLGEDADGDDPSRREERHRSFSAQSPLRRAAIIFAGPFTNFLFAFVVYALVFASAGTPVPSTTPRIGGVSRRPRRRDSAGSSRTISSSRSTAPAIDSWQNLSKTVRASDGKTLHMVVDRDGARVELDVTPEEHDCAESRTAVPRSARS